MIVIVMQKIKFMQKFTSAIKVKCLYSSLQARLIMHNHARAIMQKACFCSIYSNLKDQTSGKLVRMMHLYKSNQYRSMICRISQKPRNDRKKTVKFLFLLSIYIYMSVILFTCESRVQG